MLYAVKIFFRNEEKNEYILRSMKTKRICQQQTYIITRKARESSINKKEIMIKGNLKHQEGKRTGQEKVWVNTLGFPSLREFSKLGIMIEAKIITLSKYV